MQTPPGGTKTFSPRNADPVPLTIGKVNNRLEKLTGTPGELECGESSIVGRSTHISKYDVHMS